jgi:hypothetical protein
MVRPGGNIMNRIILSILFSAHFLILSAAHAQEPVKAGNKGPQINVQIDPKVSAANKEYDDAVKKLSPAQQEDLKKLDSDLVSAIMPKVDMTLIDAQYRHCAKTDPDLEKKYRPMMQTMRLPRTMTLPRAMSRSWSASGKSTISTKGCSAAIWVSRMP